MQLTITTWNINSVRLRIDLVAKFIKAERPDVLCLQETKCPDDKFPLKRFARLGYTHVALNGQKGYHGVAVLSRVPFDSIDVRNFCSKTDCRHIAVTFGEKAGLRDPTTVHNFYVPAGGDEPDPDDQREIRPQARLPRRDARRARAAPGREGARDPGRRPQRGAARARRLEPQADAQGGVAHADRMREAHRSAEARAAGSTPCAPSCRSRRSSTRGGATARPTGRPPTAAGGSTTSGSARSSPTAVSALKIRREARGWERPSDHVPVTAKVELCRSALSCIAQAILLSGARARLPALRNSE